jgi:hypothetical protein
MPWVPNMVEEKMMAPMHDAFWFAGPEKMEAKCKLIPNDVDYLITHTPPKGILDVRFGCPKLLDRIQTLPNLR